MSALTEVISLSLGIIFGSLIGTGVSNLSWVKYLRRVRRQHEETVQQLVKFYQEALDRKIERARVDSKESISDTEERTVK